MGAGYMQTGYYVGILIAALLNATVGAAYGWRAMFAYRRTACVPGDPDPIRRARTGPLEAARVGAARYGHAVLAALPSQDVSQRHVSFCLDQRAVGRLGVRALRGCISRRPARSHRDSNHASRVVRDHSSLRSHDFRMPRAARRSRSDTAVAGRWRSISS